MEFVANSGKSVEVEVDGKIYQRHAIKTRFVTQNDDYIDLLKEYVGGIYRDGDIVSISEKIISICQGRIVRREDVKIGRLAKFLARFATGESARGCGVGSPIKMQYAIDKKGALRIFAAAALGGACKMIGIKGVFYMIAGREVTGLDGFYGAVWEEYKDIGIEIPKEPDAVCQEIKEKLGISSMIVDANDLGQEIFGRSSDIPFEESALKKLIRDNPAGQGRQMTPLVLIREKT